MGEQRVVALDRHDGLIGRDLVGLVERVHVEVLPAVAPAPVHVLTRAAAHDRERLVDAAEQRLLLLEHLHQDARAMLLGLEQLLGEVEVRIRVVALADTNLREPEDRGVEPVSRHGRGVPGAYAGERGDH